jgi:ketosteroid isomerase-like protein
MAIDTSNRVQIEELVARYNKAIDTGDADSWADTFTEDGEFHGVVGSFHGRAELHGFAKAYATEEQYAEFASAQHWVTNMVIEGDGDDATMFSHLMMVAPAEGGGRIILVGSYEDTLRKVGGGWRFTKRVVHA